MSRIAWGLGWLLLAGCDTAVLDLGGEHATGGGNSGGSQVLEPGARVFAGGNASCVRRADGVVKCWGQNDRGQLGVATPHECSALSCTSVPATAPVLEGSREIALGRRFGCALAPEGALACWGENTFAELGRGTHDDDQHVEPRDVGLDDVSELVAGSHHVCARSAGKVWCWGLGEDGQLGLDPAGLARCGVPAEQRGQAGVPSAADVACATEPSEVAALEGAVQLALGDAHTCARFDDGKVLCVGRGSQGQLGGGDATPSSFEPVEALASGADAIAVGAEHSCALVGSQVRCWGSDARGQLGVGSVDHDSCSDEPCLLAPAPLADLPDADALTLGAYFGCARVAEGKLRCWGDDSAGQLGNSSFAAETCETPNDGSFDCLKRPVSEVYDVSGVLELRAGTSHACALLESELRCWGSSDMGQAANHDAVVTFPSTVYGLF